MVANPVSQEVPNISPMYIKAVFQITEPTVVHNINSHMFILTIPAGIDIKALTPGTNLAAIIDNQPYLLNHDSASFK